MASTEIVSDKQEETNQKEILLRTMKGQVKLLMEEYVNRKYVQEYSSNVIALCATIESCLLLGLKRRALGLFKESSSMALLEKISKQNASAKLIYNLVSEDRPRIYDSLSDSSHFSSNTNSSISSRSDVSNGSSFTNNWSPASFFGFNSNKIFSFNNQQSENQFTNLHQINLKKHYWIRLALTEKVLDKIIHFLVKNSGIYYNRDSIMADPCDGYILVSLLSGPCSLEYSKTTEFIPEDPDAVELMQKQRIQSSGSTGVEAGISPRLNHAFSTSSLFWSSGSSQVTNKPTLVSRRRLASSDSDERNFSFRKSVFSTPKHYVESLHQGAESTLLFGKNNVFCNLKDKVTKVPGYLSLHTVVNDLLIKWTPNELISGGMDVTSHSEKTRKMEWDCAMIIWVNQIVYVHCHRHVDKGDTLVLVNKDGAQIPPFDFPKGGHLISFLGCLENGLLPLCKLDPPLWFYESKGMLELETTNKTLINDFPKSADILNTDKKNDGVFHWSSFDINESFFNKEKESECTDGHASDQRILFEEIPNLSFNRKRNSSTSTLGDFSSDLVFRIVKPHHSGSTEINSDIEEDSLDDSIRKSIHQLMTHSNTNSVSQWPYKYTIGALKKKFHFKENNKQHKRNNSSIRRLCSLMKKEILSRSFYGWLAYCRHIKTIRSQLSELVLPLKNVSEKNTENLGILNKKTWSNAFDDKKKITDHSKILQQIYYGGCESSIRKKVWPFLLGVYPWDSSELERITCMKKWQKKYELAVSDWMIIETVIDDQSNPTLNTDDQNEEDCALEIQREYNQLNDDDPELSKIRDKVKKQKSVIITKRILNILKQNLNRIEKDVTRCDRNFKFFDQTDQGEANLDILQRIMCTWVWQNLEIGYIQGMCDLLAPLVVIFQGNEELTYACFCKYMEVMTENFPIKENNKMDLYFSRMRSAVQILDSDLYDHMQSYGDFTHFYFSYRWFLLDFKREFSYNDIFHIWETIWAADEVSTPNFSLFIGLSLLLSYRDLIVDNNMEFTDIIRFFNEMAEQHNTKKVLDLARELVKRLQVLLQN